MARRGSADVKRYLQEIGRVGGASRAVALTSAQRKKIASLGGRAAWARVTAAERSERMRRLFAISDELRYSGKANGSVSRDHRREALELIESLRT